MNKFRIERHLGFLVHDVAHLLRKRVDSAARELGLTRAQWSVLVTLSQREGVNQTELSEALEIDKVSLARHIHRLVARGLVERRQSPEDRRQYRLSLTDRARPALERMHGIATEICMDAMHDLEPRDRERLIAMLGIVLRRLSQSNARVERMEEELGDQPAVAGNP